MNRKDKRKAYKFIIRDIEKDLDGVRGKIPSFYSLWKELSDSGVTSVDFRGRLYSAVTVKLEYNRLIKLENTSKH